MVFWAERDAVLFVGIFFPIGGLLAVGLRFLGRMNRRKKSLNLGTDDWLILPAFVLMTACSAIFIAGFATDTIGSHRPWFDIPSLLMNKEPQQVLLEKFEFAFNILQILALGLTKLSICFFYRRIFRGKRFNIMSWTVIGLVVAWMVTFLILLTAGCGTNVSAWWGSLLDLTTKCANQFSVLLGLAVVDVAVDLMIMILPLPWILRLQLPRRQKFGVLAIFLVGSLAIGCGIARLYFFIMALAPTSVVSNLMFWGMVETGVAVIAACLPTIRPALKIISGAKPMQSLRSFTHRLLGSNLNSLFSSHKDTMQRTDSTATIARSQGSGVEDTAADGFEMDRVGSGAGGKGGHAQLGRIYVDSEYKVEHAV
ncbi:hypothetical protein BDV95DRAFT_604828 [Massariosphaeria phaeospora]|uniref:Rhodopsin domain-containing protein n=1 Tax=Massariosphaeria phaeospora TaxID=100035 RepID=A0A7C8M841_9PLEO|nr:hypothetical protein BDV95DRAFT_604828 [Massariosphaeria phaeospora]